MNTERKDLDIYQFLNLSYRRGYELGWTESIQNLPEIQDPSILKTKAVEVLSALRDDLWVDTQPKIEYDFLEFSDGYKDGYIAARNSNKSSIMLTDISIDLKMSLYLYTLDYLIISLKGSLIKKNSNIFGRYFYSNDSPLAAIDRSNEVWKLIRNENDDIFKEMSAEQKTKLSSQFSLITSEIDSLTNELVKLKVSRKVLDYFEIIKNRFSKILKLFVEV